MSVKLKIFSLTISILFICSCAKKSAMTAEEEILEESMRPYQTRILSDYAASGKSYAQFQADYEERTSKKQKRKARIITKMVPDTINEMIREMYTERFKKNNVTIDILNDTIRVRFIPTRSNSAHTYSYIPDKHIKETLDPIQNFQHLKRYTIEPLTRFCYESGGDIIITGLEERLIKSGMNRYAYDNSRIPLYVALCVSRSSTFTAEVYYDRYYKFANIYKLPIYYMNIYKGNDAKPAYRKVVNDMKNYKEKTSTIKKKNILHYLYSEINGSLNQTIKIYKTQKINNIVKLVIEYHYRQLGNVRSLPVEHNKIESIIDSNKNEYVPIYDSNPIITKNCSASSDNTTELIMAIHGCRIVYNASLIDVNSNIELKKITLNGKINDIISYTEYHALEEDMKF